MPFNLEDWKTRSKRNGDEFERNSLMDSGWSAAVNDRCLHTSATLMRELVLAIAETETKPEDYFDRPDLVAIQEAARSLVPSRLDRRSSTND